ncbi:hypothetical protein BJ138DRAFT_1144295 [Hygrophoropsis aurantiaca]|uniref:Uncharacterized protein n=1 Tax=Hygrophoropsis aurantiaca TaxID=72124 RepID=A0ACB8ALQ3_9AGAM|nr:hypothetical protein BJ138DRAFT_1144295 [Hygrophoropsis aurantiaca]
MPILGLLLFSPVAFAALAPTYPGPNQSCRADSDCTIKWLVDTTNSWKNVTVQLMSGSNSNMTLVDIVASQLDGTDSRLTPFNWTCPEVAPYSNIYFYQFTNNGPSPEFAWTTRFMIESPSGESTPAEYTEQPSGAPIPWGNGHLVSYISNSSMIPAHSTRKNEQNTDDYMPPTSSHSSKTPESATAAKDNPSTSPVKVKKEKQHHEDTWNGGDHAEALLSGQTPFPRSITSYAAGRPTSKGNIRGASSSIYILCAFSVLWMMV